MFEDGLANSNKHGKLTDDATIAEWMAFWRMVHHTHNALQGELRAPQEARGDVRLVGRDVPIAPSMKTEDPDIRRGLPSSFRLTSVRTAVAHTYPDRTIHLTLIDCESAPGAEPTALVVSHAAEMI